MRQRKKILSVLMLFSLMLALTNFCVAMLFYPSAVKAVRSADQGHFDCGEPAESLPAKIKLTASKTSGTLLPCCVERNQDNDSAIFTAEKPLTLMALAPTPDNQQILQKFLTNGYTAELWPPPEQTIIDSTIIRI